MRSILFVLAALSLSACSGAAAGGTFNNPFHQAEQVLTAPPYDGHVRWFSSWQDTRPETRAFTNAITINVDCDDPDAVTHAQQILDNDTRAVIWFAPMFAYGGEGYELRPNAAACWQRERDLIRTSRARSIAVWLMDEPPDTAWSFWVDGGTRYDPNRYNGILTTATAMVRADFPDLDVAYNFGSLPDDAVVAAGPTLIAVEGYAADWQAKLTHLETLTSNPLWLIMPGFVDGDPVAADPILAQRVRDQWTWSQHDQRVTGLYYFLQCCEDEETGDKQFHAAGGGHLPLTLAVLQAIGQLIRGN
jgi:hypothetical protein